MFTSCFKATTLIVYCSLKKAFIVITMIKTIYNIKRYILNKIHSLLKNYSQLIKILSTKTTVKKHTKKNWRENFVDHFISWFHIAIKRVNCTHKICKFRFAALCEGDLGSMGWIFTISASNSMLSLHPPLFHYIIGLCNPGIQRLLPGVVDLPLLFWPSLQTPTWPCLLDLVPSGYLGFTISQLLEPLTR